MSSYAVFVVSLPVSAKTNGGTGGIRTHAPFRTNGFQDRLVMTASIPFRVLPDKQDLLYRINRTLSTLFLQICIKEKPGEIFSGPVYQQSSFIRYFSCRAAARMKYNLRSRLIKTGSMYHGFYTPRGSKFPHGNFRTSVFCGAKRCQNTLVGKNISFFDSSPAIPFP